MNMEKFKLTNQYQRDLKLEGVLERFTDEIAGKLNCYLEDNEILESNIANNYHKENLLMENDMKLQIEIYYNDKEWECTCIQLDQNKGVK